jgi:hypothetical protein
VRTTVAPPVETAADTVWRCGGRDCGAGECRHEEDELHRDASGAGPEHAPRIVHDVLGSSGAALPGEVRTDMEARLGHDFADVRVHTDSRAAESAAAVRSHAYTVGRRIVFGDGQFRPQSSEGRRLLAHELVHAMGARRGDPVVGTLRVSSPQDGPEVHAARAARAALAGDAPRSGPVREDAGLAGAPGATVTGIELSRNRSDQEVGR